ncbi:putative bifunctional diguanylate cyclase/phosphodiesterase [Thiorhodococcus fuscus]|uniref:Bifunctional diguanylate cyclase/phosphodiesterase n=1 Tax=Thiorhodococcus fuscus TaxID=527200 RepID=A0ABW4YDB3_9GAMM
MGDPNRIGGVAVALDEVGDDLRSTRLPPADGGQSCPRAPGSSAAAAEQLHSALIDEAFRQGWAGIPMTAVSMLGMAGIHWLHTHALIEPFWLVSGFVVFVLRMLLLFVHDAYRETLSTLTRARMFEWPLVLNCLVWAALPILVFPSAEPVERLAMIAIIAGLAGGGAAVLAPVLWSARLYILCLMLPASIMILDTPGSGPVVFVLGIGFMALSFFSHARTRDVLVMAQQRLIENQALLAEMREQRSVVDRLNQELLSAQQRLLEHSLALEVEVEERTARMRLAFSVIENTAEGIMVMSIDGRILEVNPGFTRITGYASEEVIGRSFKLLRSDRHGEDFFDQLWRCLHATGRWDGEMWSRRKDGEVFLERRVVDVVCDPEGQPTHYVSVFSDVTSDYHKDQQLLHQALHDPLTGLGNRKLLLDRLEHGIAQSRRNGCRFGVLIFDLDQFKAVNDSLGHHVGDQLLCEVAGRLKARLRASDTLVRLGGDEFVALMSDLRQPDDAVVLAHELLDAFARPFELPNNRMHVRSSLGIAIYPDDGTDPDVLMKNADMALYAAKAAGRNTYHFFKPIFADQASERLELELALREAMERQELSLYYQPKVAASDHGFLGFEALLRWNRGELGFVPPDRFVPVAEDCGLIGQIGSWVLAEACGQIARWYRAGYGWRKVAINVSARQLVHDDLVGMIGRECERQGISPTLLEVEVTESCVMSNPSQTSPILAALRAMGVSVAIDDFGTGHSSLSYLRRLPVDVIKIDRSFVHEAARDTGAEAIVKTIVNLSKTLGMDVVAEGVETLEQAEMLARMECDVLQGYCFAQPMPVDEIERRWRESDATPSALGLAEI